MNELNTLFRQRIGFSNSETITFENLHEVLEKTALAIPFENLAIFRKDSYELTKETLLHKIVNQNEGGLCYELNGLLYFFLKENGFTVSFIRGIVYDHVGQHWNKVGKTHVINVITHKANSYIVDTGFGANLALRPIPLHGGIVTSLNGDFKIEETVTEHGDHILYMKLHDKDKDWKIGYAFDSKEQFQHMQQIHDVQATIKDHQDSPFNKKPLMTKLTRDGQIILTENGFTEWNNGIEKKRKITENQFEEIKKNYFGMYSD